MSALVDGEDVRPFPDGPLVRAVDLKIVRTEFEKQYYADGDDRQRKAARRVAFGRAMKAAQAANLVAVREINGTQMIWLAKPERG